MNSILEIPPVLLLSGYDKTTALTYSLCISMYVINTRSKIMDIISLVLKAVAMGMAIASLVLGFFPKETSVKTHITLLSIGLTALAVASLQ